jgi:hypothetical protein
MLASLLNLSVYSPLEYALYSMGGMLWVIVYLLIFFQARKTQFVGVPALGMWAYLSWEILWGFVYTTDLGSLFVWGLKGYMPLNACICWLIVRYGYRQFQSELFHRYQVLAYGFALGAWTAFLYFFIPAVDDGAGITSAYILNAIMSATYLPLLLRLYEQGGKAQLNKLSFPVAWLKMLATVCNFAFCLLHLPERRWMHVVCLVTLLLDVAYCYAFTWMKSSKVSRQAVRSVRSRKPQLGRLLPSGT